MPDPAPSFRRRCAASVAACFALAVVLAAQEQPVPRSVFAMQFETSKDANTPATEVRLKSVMRGGPADLAGLRAGDVILKLNDEPVTPENWFEVMRSYPPGSQVRVSYSRDGQAAIATVTVGDRVETYTRLANGGDAEAAESLGQTYWSGQGADQNRQEALRWFRMAAERGNAGAASQLGSIYYSGQSVPKDLAEALRWYRVAAERGNAPAASQLGWMYAHGEGAPVNGPEAVRWLGQAAVENFPPALLTLGLVYHFGLGVAKNPEQAAMWYRKAADQGVPGAMNNLGVMYVNGEGVPKSIYEAISWYRKAAEKLEPFALRNLAINYYNGTGVPQDYAQAYLWWLLAKANGNTQADPVLDGLPQKLTAQQVAEAQRRVTTWMASNVILTTAPPQASVYFNNQYRGTTDSNGRLELHDLAAGQYTVRVTAPGYQDAIGTVFLAAHGNTQQQIRLRPATADLSFQTTPGGAQVYVNDEFKGASSAEGALVVSQLPQGSYRVRVSLSGYNDWTQSVELKPGAPQRVEARLERAGPPPLTLSDVLGLLQGDVSPVRVATLVKERGVDFELNDEREKQIRSAGGDSDLLLVITRSRR